jgi:hypothetical protein
MSDKQEELNTESGCPCGEATCSADCEVCQDLPIGYFENRRREEELNKEYETHKNRSI